MSDMVKTIAVAVAVLLVGLAIGFFVGRWTLERQWSQPFVQVSPKAAQRSAEGDADPTPPAGATILRRMPIQRARKVLREVTAKDPAVVTVGSISAYDDVLKLHAVVENRASCEITAVEGTGYAFDARGVPAKANKHGETYFSFSGKGLAIDPGTHATVTQPMRYVDTASLVVASVDRFTCSDGTTWKRQ
jgi:hypothetical protein